MQDILQTETTRVCQRSRSVGSLAASKYCYSLVYSLLGLAQPVDIFDDYVSWLICIGIWQTCSSEIDFDIVSHSFGFEEIWRPSEISQERLKLPGRALQ